MLDATPHSDIARLERAAQEEISKGLLQNARVRYEILEHRDPGEGNWPAWGATLSLAVGDHTAAAAGWERAATCYERAGRLPESINATRLILTVAARNRKALHRLERLARETIPSARPKNSRTTVRARATMPIRFDARKTGRFPASSFRAKPPEHAVARLTTPARSDNNLAQGVEALVRAYLV